MAHKLTPKENYQRLLKGEIPEWVPVSALGPSPDGNPPATATVFPSLLSSGMMSPGVAQDVFGVTYVPCKDAGGAKVPDPSKRIMSDITKWRDIIKVPDVSDFDWEAMAKKDLEKANINRETTLVSLGSHFGYFQYLMAFMGYDEGLCAVYEEPEEIMALMDYLGEFFIKVIESTIDYYKPDIIDMCDDIASWKNLFVSPKSYQEIFKPITARQAKIATDRGLPISMHCCGHCEGIIDDWIDFGVKLWNPAQTCNDLAAIKKKYGNSLVICGGWDGRDELLRPDVTEAEIKESVYRSFDMLAPGGGYVFSGGFLGFGDETVKQKNKWVQEAAYECWDKYY